MTRGLAEDRAKEIWGEEATVQGVMENKHAHLIGSSTTESWTVRTPDGRYHGFDQNGHTNCHEACAQLERERCV